MELLSHFAISFCPSIVTTVSMERIQSKHTVFLFSIKRIQMKHTDIIQGWGEDKCTLLQGKVVLIQELSQAEVRWIIVTISLTICFLASLK